MGILFYFFILSELIDNQKTQRKMCTSIKEAFDFVESGTVETTNFIDGKFCAAESHKLLDSYNPATGEVWAKIPDSEQTDVNHAVEAAKRAFIGSLIQTEPYSTLNYVVKQPIGVAGLISPWNFPLYLLSFKIAPAIAAGNTVVAKPSEFTSVSAWLLAHVFVEAGLPPGVVNLVFGTGPKAGQPLVVHPSVHAVSFTGSTVIGRKIAALTAPQTKKISLELGGKNPCIVFADAKIDEAIPVIVRSCFLNQGEICLCTSRLFVQKSIFEEFMTKFVKQAKSFKVGPPTDPDSKLGALVSKQHWNKVNGYVEMAKNLGAVFHCGLEPIVLPDEYKNGYYISPTVITGVSDTSPFMQEEIFGPFVCVCPFDSEEEVVARANCVEYGLSASLWSQNVTKVHRVAQKLQAGTVWCNCWLVRELNMPFGGMKASGIGREGAKDSIEFFTEKKTICVKLD